jgi:hypothetical protein
VLFGPRTRQAMLDLVQLGTCFLLRILWWSVSTVISRSE